ncbi:MAG: putative DNA binding domain-containing protein, partial [Candidatus Adiutrix sp.]|nr:putative DNA binding domain-containing protein [Candidatus Adiutrix sp.]
MRIKDIFSDIALGEDSGRQFKTDIRNADSLASEMAAFANSEGGLIYIGVTDNGEVKGFDKTELQRLNQLISNAASHLVRSPLSVRTKNVALKNGRLLIVLTVPKGLDKPYFDKNGVIWLKAGADKRRINSKEELRRFFQLSGQFHADELPTKAGLDKLDKLRFRDFLRSAYGQEFPESSTNLANLLCNMNLATDDNHLNMAGLLLFGERPELIAPQFVVKAIHYPGNEIHTSDYLDTEDFAGPLPKIFENVQAFVMRNLHKVQAGRGINSPGLSEIPASAIEELLVNALIHRDYLISAPIRLFIFDNRLEIINPGSLPNNLTVDKIRAGNSNIRNPILVSYAAKGLLPYHGLGSGIKRALSAWPDIEFINDPEGSLFTCLVNRKPIDKINILAADSENSVETGNGSVKTANNSVETGNGSVKTADSSVNRQNSSVETDDKIISQLTDNPKCTITELAVALKLSSRAVEKKIARLKKDGRLT